MIQRARSMRWVVGVAIGCFFLAGGLRAADSPLEHLPAAEPGVEAEQPAGNDDVAPQGDVISLEELERLVGKPLKLCSAYFCGPNFPTVNCRIVCDDPATCFQGRCMPL